MLKHEVVYCDMVDLRRFENDTTCVLCGNTNEHVRLVDIATTPLDEGTYVQQAPMCCTCTPLGKEIMTSPGETRLLEEVTSREQWDQEVITDIKNDIREETRAKEDSNSTPVQKTEEYDPFADDKEYYEAKANNCEQVE